ncbi:fungal Rad9-like Rad53-binding-domain-containing protein [Aspergillus falconensis]
MGSAGTMPSDTQVISQSVYDEIIRKNKEAGNDGPDGNVLDRNTLMTLQECDSGHIDLLSGFDAAQIHAPTTDENDDQSSFKLGESSPLPYERNHFPESQRFLAKTPLTTTKQRHVSTVSTVSTVSPLVSRNPLASDLESASGIMALSQVFKATQAPSSPLVNGLQSDLLSDRPSPNIPIQNRPLAPTLSSPTINIAATFPRELSDAQLNYVTVKESQANRNDMARERMTRSADNIYSDDQSDGEFYKEPSFIERIKRKRRVDEEAAAQFSRVSAPARHSSEIEERTGGRAISSSRVSERRDLEDSGAAVQPEQQGIASDLQAVGTSEEETEHEEELPKPMPRSQGLNPSTEEDKENCDDLPVALSHTESAHDRLSQALSFHESPTSTRRELAQTFSDARSPPRNEDMDIGTVDVVRSSPISVVKDSQWSPRRDDTEQAEQTIVESPSNQVQTRLRDPQRQSVAAAGHGHGRLSPANQPFTQGSQAYSQNAPVAILPLPEFADSARSSNPSLEGSGATHANMLHLRDAANRPETGDRMLTFGAREKSSSMPSRVAETPVHHRQRISNDLPFATIPETSPTRLNNEGWLSDGDNEGADQEDDDLPPPYPKAMEHTNQSRPVISQSSSPVKRLLNSKILSSPSGRQRRALTEIAADASPQVGAPAIDVNIDIMSAEDYEFRDAVAQSPVPARKKRRGNDGRNIPASDPIISVTPRAETRPTPPQEEEETLVALLPQPIVPANQRPNTFLRRRMHSRRAGSIWDTEDSPKFRVSSEERSQLFARSQARERQLPLAPEHELEETPQPTPVPAQVPVEKSSTPVCEAPRSELVVEESPADIGQQSPPDSAILVPNQVLAPWRGQKRAYYPAVCLGTPFGTSQDQYVVKFEDSAPVEVPKGAVKRLELRIGDAVKVDMPHIPKVTHIIRGFAHKLSAEDAVKAVTDIYGHATLVVGPKQRKSLPNGEVAGPENVINVPVSRIYLDTILWNKIKDRSYTYNSGSGGSESRLQTPSDRHITPTSPSTRLSRSLRPSNGLFSGMVFAVSYGDKSETKYRITKMILENDGRILEDGFNELFELPLNAPIATPTKAAAPQPPGMNSHLRLKPDVEEAGFTCLIADKHSRRPKYMQALALNIPCLSDRWVEDCVAKGQVMDWEMYLLPAGESSYLNGATKSRILTPYPATRARLSKTVAARPNLLNGQSVLLITGRNGKADEERRKAYIFLTYALGASKIERVPDIQSARAALHKQLQDRQETSSWDWVYIDDDEKAAKALAAGPLPSKRRRNARLTEAIGGDDLGLSSNVRVVGNEFVCQSLILGRLVDQ